MFKSLKIVDCSTVLAGPSVATFFAELGAKVIKVENPDMPDVTRSWKLPSENSNAPISAYFASANYRKTYVKIDLKKQLGELLALIADADIFISNFKKGDAAKFGIEDDVLLQLNPRLIHAKISGFGDESDRVAYDLILQAETGFMSMNGTPDSDPIKMPVALIDVLAAHHLKEGILVALMNRVQSQKGSIVGVSLYDAAVCSLANQATNYLMQHAVPKRMGSLHPTIAPYGEQFITSDKKQITFAIGSNAHFQKLCDFLGVPELAENPLFKDNYNRVINRQLLAEHLQPAIEQHTAFAMDQAMRAAFIPMGIIRNLQEVFDQKSAQSLIREEEIDGFSTKRVTQIAFQLK